MLCLPIRHDKSVLRSDLFVYYRRFRPNESLSVCNNVLAYFVQVGLIDNTKARPQVLIYELTRATHHDKLSEASNKLKAQETVSRDTSSSHRYPRYGINHVLLFVQESQCVCHRGLEIKMVQVR